MEEEKNQPFTSDEMKEESGEERDSIQFGRRGWGEVGRKVEEGKKHSPVEEEE